MLCVQNGRHCNFKQVHFYSVFLSICYIAQNQCVFLKGFTMVFTRFTCFKLHCLLLPFWIPVKKNRGVCPHQMQTVSSGVLDGKLWQKCLTCSISYRFFLSYPIIAIAAVWSWLRAWSCIRKGQGEQDCILRYVCLIHWFSSSPCILLALQISLQNKCTYLACSKPHRLRCPSCILPVYS